MEVRIGYFPLLDTVLALRQAYDSIRFSPFNPVMQEISQKLDEEERRKIEDLGTKTDGWLLVIKSLLEQGAAGLLGSEEVLVRLTMEPRAALPIISATAKSETAPEELGRVGLGASENGLDSHDELCRLLASILKTDVGPEAARRSHSIIEATEIIATRVGKGGVWPFILGISDRLFKNDSGELVFRIKPEFRIKEDEVERVVICPSLVATRHLTFWHSGRTLLFYIAVTAPGGADNPPDGLLITALAVGDRTRLRMLRSLAGRPRTNLEMAEYLGMNPSTVSRHFKVFKDAGFVELIEREGGRVEYELRQDAIERAFADIAGFIAGRMGK